jgi:SPP1 gp7 family putative phage head morphogenesis protein
VAYDLAAIAKRSTRRRKSVAAAPISPTQARQDELALIYLTVVRGWQAGAKEQILPAYGALIDQLTRDDEQTGLAAALRTLAGQMGSVVTSLRPRLTRWLSAFGGWHDNRFAQTINVAVGVDPKVFMSPTEIAATIDVALERNAALVKDLSDQLQGRIAERVWAGVSQQTPRDVMARQIAEATGMSRKRAKRIAVDQSIKLGADLDTIRQKEAGLDEFKWRSSHKLHPRPWHAARDGKVYGFDAIPADDMPGVPINCGCKKQPWINLD